MKKILKITVVSLLVVIVLLMCGMEKESSMSFTLWEYLLGAVFFIVAYMFYTMYYSIIEEIKKNSGYIKDDCKETVTMSIVTMVGVVAIMLSIPFYAYGYECMNKIVVPEMITIKGVAYPYYKSCDAYLYIIIGILLDVVSLALPFLSIDADKE